MINAEDKNKLTPLFLLCEQGCKKKSDSNGKNCSKK